MNSQIVSEFEKLVDQIKYTIDTEKTKDMSNVFRLKQVKNAIDIINKYPSKITSGDQLSNIKGIGKGTIARIDEILKTGKLSEIKDMNYQEAYLKESEDLEKIYGIGNKTANDLITKYNIHSVDQLIKEYKNKKIIVPRKIELGIKYYGKYESKIKREEIELIDKYIGSVVKKIDKNLIHTICGSYRRGKPESNDIDILLVHKKLITLDQFEHSKKHYLRELVKYLTLDKFLLDDIDENYDVKYMGFCKYKKHGIHRIDIMYMPYSTYPTALLHFTGSGDFNQKIRDVANTLGYTLNQYGLYKLNKDGTKGKRVENIKSEEDVFKILHLEYVNPINRN